MGDRGNIVVVTPPFEANGEVIRPASAVVLYTHWGGTRLPITVAEVLAKRDRWNDPAYLARIFFSAMTAGQEDSTIGYGITAWPDVCDNEHPIIVVDTGTGRVGEVPEPNAKTPVPRIADDEGASFEEIAESCNWVEGP